MGKTVHWMGSGGVNHVGTTACGIQASNTKDAKEYRTFDGGSLVAKYRSWDGVTCKRCLRNPFAPGGRIIQQQRSEP